MPFLLIVDHFHGHLKDSVWHRMQEMRADVAVISGGLTSMLKPLDASINKPFNDDMWRLYMELMANHDLTPAEKIRIQCLLMDTGAGVEVGAACGALWSSSGSRNNAVLEQLWGIKR